MNSKKQKIKAVGLLSGGLDSMLAARLIKEQGIEVHALYFAMPWSVSGSPKAKKAAASLGIPLTIIPLQNNYLKILKNPKRGYGGAFNPCIDCHAYMIRLAGEFMKKIGASFVFTGEVKGQRPMSQHTQAMELVVRDCGIAGRLLRPLSAQLLEPTLPEIEGIVNREKLLSINGRSRKEQRELAKNFGIKDYPNPAGGCLLTDKNFGLRMKDLLDHGASDYKETILLQWGRHFRFNKEYKAILGRDERENEYLNTYAEDIDHIFEFVDRQGPTLILQGNKPSEATAAQAAGLVQYFSKFKNKPAEEVSYWMKKHPENIQKVTAAALNDQDIQKLQILI